MNKKFYATACGFIAIGLSAAGISPASATPVENHTATSSVDQCVANLNYNPVSVLAQKPGDTYQNLPATESSLQDGVFTVVKHEKKHIESPESGFSAAGLPQNVVFPGALVNVDQNLLDNRPTLLSADRTGKPITISADLPGVYKQTAKVETPNASDVNTSINGILDSWHKNGVYHNQASRIEFSETLAKDSHQVSADLGYQFALPIPELEAKLGIDFSAASKGEKQYYVASLRQIFYTVSVDQPNRPSNWLSDNSANDVCGQHVPGYISHVDYGRQIFVVAESESKDNDFKAALSVAIKEHNPKLSGHFQQIVNNSKVKAIVIGGSAADQVSVTSGNVEQIRKVINNNANYSPNNPAAPIGYNVKFLKDNTEATAKSVADYYDTTVETHTSGKLVIKQDGWYVARYNVSWDEITGFEANGTPKYEHKTWRNNGQSRTLGASDLITLPATARHINVFAEEATGLVWDPWRVVIDEHNLALVGERDFTLRGTTLNSWSESKVK